MQLKRIANLIACNSYIPQRSESFPLTNAAKRGWFIPADAAVRVLHIIAERKLFK